MPIPRLGLIRARTDRGWTQGRLCAELGRTGLSDGVTVETVSRWENRRIGVSWKNRRALARVFGLTVHEVSRLIDDQTSDEVAAMIGAGPGHAGWEVPVDHLPWRPCTALTGLSGLGADLR